ncbi:hypothetical protein M0R45_000186 [Rubus argutus]|uniref:Uncharacterized protein n=1 Tax=Rubus argutus TaxID=59490 RepID=A0AAW1VQ16_RUBAR
MGCSMAEQESRAAERRRGSRCSVERRRRTGMVVRAGRPGQRGWIGLGSRRRFGDSEGVAMAVIVNCCVIAGARWIWGFGSSGLVEKVTVISRWSCDAAVVE